MPRERTLMFVHTRRWLGRGIAVAGVLAGHAQVATAQEFSVFQVCSNDALANCALVRFTSTPGSMGGPNLFQIAIQNQGAANPATPTSIYYLVLLMGTPPSLPDVSGSVQPMASGPTASVNNPTSAWNLSEVPSGSDDFLALYSPVLEGVGSCAPDNGALTYAYMGHTCGADDFITFDFTSDRWFDPHSVSIADLEVDAGAAGTASCIDAISCNTRLVTASPEPASIALVGTGLFGLVGFVRRKRRDAADATQTREG